MKEIRLGIVGLGRFAQLHVACLRSVPGVKIVAICDIRSEQVEALSQELQCRGYTNVSQMLQEESLDALDVLTPEAHHYESVMAGLEAGCHVFVEKPLAIDVSEAEQMIEKATVHERLLMVGHVTRFDPRYIRMKQAVEKGQIGRLRSIYTRRSDRREFFDLYKRTSPVYILGVHDIDQILWYTDELPEEVYAKSSSSEEGEDLVCAMLTFRDGTIATIDCNWMTPKSWPAAQDQYTQVMGETGVLRMQNPDQAISVCTEEAYDFPDMHASRNLYGHIEGALMSELRHFIDCIHSSQPSTILRPEDALNVIRVAAAIVRSCEIDQPVAVSSMVTP